MMQKLYTSCLLKSRENGHLTSMRACSFICVTVRSRGLRFDSQLGSSCIATLDKLFKPLCLHQQSVNLAMLCSWEGDHSSGMHWQFVADFSSLTSKPIKVTWVLHSHIIAECILYLTCFFFDVVQIPMSFEQFEDVRVSRGWYMCHANRPPPSRTLLSEF